MGAPSRGRDYRLAPSPIPTAAPRPEIQELQMWSAIAAKITKEKSEASFRWGIKSVPLESALQKGLIIAVFTGNTNNVTMIPHMA
jgi:hypothetical protein